MQLENHAESAMLCPRRRAMLQSLLIQAGTIILNCLPSAGQQRYRCGPESPASR